MSHLPPFNAQPTLVGPTLTLRPLRASDLDALHAAASDPLIWEQHPDPLRYRRDVFEARFFAPGLASGGALVAIDHPTQQIMGSSRYYDLDAAQQELAIGFTFLARPYWGGPRNREMKTLMLDHAFGWARRVWFHIGPQNLRSRKAVENIGARFSHQADRVLQGLAQPTAFYVIERP